MKRFYSQGKTNTGDDELKRLRRETEVADDYGLAKYKI